MQVEMEDLHIPERDLPVHLDVTESERIAASSKADLVKKSASVYLYVQNRVSFRTDGNKTVLMCKSL